MTEGGGGSGGGGAAGKARLFVPPERFGAGPFTLSGGDFRYLARVRRLRAGDHLTLFDGEGNEADGTVTSVDAVAGTLVISAGSPRGAAAVGGPRPVTLVCALLKGEKMDLVVQKATELGVARIVPAAAARSVVRLDVPRATGRVARWQKVAREAARQCGRGDAPLVSLVAPLDEALREVSAGLPEGSLRVLFYEGDEGAKATPLREALGAQAAAPPAIAVAIGPEGGFAPEEITAARDAGWTIAGFGPRILRAETAALAALAVLGYAVGDLG